MGSSLCSEESIFVITVGDSASYMYATSVEAYEDFYDFKEASTISSSIYSVSSWSAI
jgi:hypothetical protein